MIVILNIMIIGYSLCHTKYPYWNNWKWGIHICQTIAKLFGAWYAFIIECAHWKHTCTWTPGITHIFHAFGGKRYIFNMQAIVIDTTSNINRNLLHLVEIQTKTGIYPSCTVIYMHSMMCKIKELQETSTQRSMNSVMDPLNYGTNLEQISKILHHRY